VGESFSSIEDSDLKWILDRISRKEIHYKDLEAFLENPKNKRIGYSKSCKRSNGGKFNSKNIEFIIF